ncbi:MAG TPA: BACON domain-containing carbohydrate-binding protein [Vicinamibacterales bacterium]|jgi:hypothetical protein
MLGKSRALVIVLAAAVMVSGSCGSHDSPIEPSPVCSFGIAPASATYSADGGSSSVTVSAPAGCTWTASTTAAWMSITAGANGNGNGTVAYSVGANQGTDPRTGSLRIADQTHAVVQQGRAPTVCSYELTPASADLGAEESRGTFTVTAPADCAWTATSNASWLVVTSGSPGTGNGTVSYTAMQQTDTSTRAAAIAVGDKTFAVRQGGNVGACQYSVTPVDFSPCMPASSVTATLTTQAGCTWTVNPSVPWLDIPSGTSGSGPATITIAFSENYDAPRDGIAMVRWPTPTAGQNVRIAQAGCVYAVSQSAINVTAAATSGTFDVIQQSVPNTCGGATQDRCRWTAVSDVAWITITTSMPRMGDDRVAFAVASNDGAASRVGRITVRDKVVVITQAGR